MAGSLGNLITIVSVAWMISGPARAIDFTITYDTRNSLSLEVGGEPLSVQTGSEPLSSSLVGTEQSQCNPSSYGRKSSSSAQASTSITEAPNGFSASMGISVNSAGGHYRTCVVGCDPFSQNCVGIVGHDTKALSRASTHTQAKIQFNPNILQNTYNLRLSPSQPSATTVTLTKPDGSVSPITTFTEPVLLSVKPGDSYFLNVTVMGSTENVGGCCSDQKDIAAQLNVTVERAPILSTKASLSPYILGGQQTSPGSYKYVVALLIDGKLQCTGTLIGKRAILTAAHCIHGFEDQIAVGRMSALVGQNITQPVSPPVQIISAVYPRGTDIFQYNPETQAHDVAVAVLNADLPAIPQKIHTGKPQWSSLLNKVSLTFVGFGYNRAGDGGLVAPGILRELPWKADKADDWRFYYEANSKGLATTCSGDSGGPAFYQDPNTLDMLVVGITSGGDADCTWGADTRVDSHSAWIAAHIQ